MTGIGETPPAPVVTPVENRGRGPSARVTLGLITAAFVALVGISLVGQPGGRPGQQAAGGAPTASPVAAASQAPSATPLVSSSPPQPAQAPLASPTSRPSGASEAVPLEMPSIEEVIAATELVDPTGDVSWRPTSGPATQPPGTPNIDVSRIVGWIAGETLYAEVTLEGQMPKAPDRIPALRLWVRVVGDHPLAGEAPIVCRPLCEQWGSFFPVPFGFTYRVKQLPSQWVATFAFDLARLGTTGTTEYRISVSADAYSDHYASDWYDEAGPLVVKRSS